MSKLINGKMLEGNLLRGGVDLTIETDILVVDVTNGRIGIKNAAPAQVLDVTGNAAISGDVSSATALIAGLTFNTNEITSSSSVIAFGDNIKFTSTAGNLIGTGTNSALTVATAASTTAPYYTGNLLPATAKDWDAVVSTGSAVGFYLTPDGTTVFFLDDNASTTTTVYQATLSTAYLISSAGAITSNTITTTSALGALGLTFNPNGLEIYISKPTGVTPFNNTVEKFTLSVAFDTGSTVTQIGTGLLDHGADYNFAPTYASSGNKAYVGSIDAGVAYIDEYDLGTAYDLTAATWLARISIDTQITHASLPISVTIAEDGSRVVAAQYDGTNDQIATYNIGTAYDITTAVIDGSGAVDSDTATVNVQSIFFSSTGDELYTMMAGNDVYQYDAVEIVPGNSTPVLNFNGTEKLTTNTDGILITGDLDFTGADSILTPPTYATASLPAGTLGGMVYDSSTKQIKVYDGTTWAASGAAPGMAMYVLTAATTNATITEALDANSSTLDLADNTTWRFEANIVARRTDAGAIESSGYKFTGVIARDTGAAAIVGIVAEVVDAEDDASWFVTVDANVNALRVQVTGALAKDISWVVFIRTVEVSD